jgi:hypothetical protein
MSAANSSSFGGLKMMGEREVVSEEKLQSEINRSFDNDRELQERLRNINGTMMRGTVRRSGQGGAWAYDLRPDDKLAADVVERIIADLQSRYVLAP